MEQTLEYVKTLSLEQLYQHTLHDLKYTLKKRDRNRVYRQSNEVKARRRKQYYVKNDIYHPTNNPAGRAEKRHKRPGCAQATGPTPAGPSIST